MYSGGRYEGNAAWRSRSCEDPADGRETAGGLYIPQTAQEKTQEGVVAEIGDDKDVIKVKVGDKIMYDKYAGTSIKIGGDEHLIIRYSDILAVIG